MTAASSRSQKATTDLGSAHVFLTGATGFVGQAVLERLLSAHPDTTISILVRTKAGDDTAARVSELLAKPVFDSWREKVGDKAVAKAAKERIRIVEGAMGFEAFVASADLEGYSGERGDGAIPLDQLLDGDEAFRHAVSASPPP